MRVSHAVRPPLPSGSACAPQSIGAVRKPIVVAKIKPAVVDPADMRPVIDLSQIDWVVHPDSNDILFFITGDDWFIDVRLLPPEFVRQAYIESGLDPARSCPACS